MSLRDFLDAAHTLLVDGLMKIGMPMPRALDDMRDLSAGRKPPAEVREDVAMSDNDRALAMFNQTMAGVTGRA